MSETSKRELFESVPVPRALSTMAVPTVISQLINLIYNMVDTLYIDEPTVSALLKLDKPRR